MDEGSALIFRQLQTDTRDARAEITDAKRSIAKLYTDLAELTATVQGAQGDNGLRSDVRELEIWRAKVELHLNSLDSMLQHYFDVEREATCHGISALGEHIEEHEKKEGDEMKLKEANISARAVILAAVVPSGIAAMVSVLSVLFASGVLG